MQWLDREIHTLGLRYGLCLDEKAFKKELKRLGFTESIPFLKDGNAIATTHHLVNKHNKAYCSIVTMPQNPTASLEQHYALLVHEGMHIWQRHLESIGESNPSHEFAAYAMQNIAQNLMCAYRDMTKRKRRK